MTDGDDTLGHGDGTRPARRGASGRLAVADVPEMLYGAVVTASVLVVVSVHAPDDDRVVLAAIVVSAVYWLTHVYVDAVGGRFADPDHPSHTRLVHALGDNWSILIGSAPPIVVLVLARALGADAVTASWIGLWYTVAMIVGVGAYAAHRAGARGWQLALETAVAGCFGVAVILLKYSLH